MIVSAGFRLPFIKGSHCMVLPVFFGPSCIFFGC